jgi:hypothetical protein
MPAVLVVLDEHGQHFEQAAFLFSDLLIGLLHDFRRGAQEAVSPRIALMVLAIRWAVAQVAS